MDEGGYHVQPNHVPHILRKGIACCKSETLKMLYVQINLINEDALRPNYWGQIGRRKQKYKKHSWTAPNQQENYSILLLISNYF
ncbi:unnamed protein product [Trifolium pratense]|uniref:Uncharacterized protein n=1 Tax=Trifolium pratense TaxID=57577 RepID=A0ACB0LRN2_TRIPR|nr:unnamed protein product [Trifolium pratense]